MNDYLEAQIINMIAIVRTFENSCMMAVLKNDGRIDKTEERQLKKITAASEKFISRPINEQIQKTAQKYRCYSVIQRHDAIVCLRIENKFVQYFRFAHL